MIVDFAFHGISNDDILGFIPSGEITRVIGLKTFTATTSGYGNSVHGVETSIPSWICSRNKYAAH